MFLTVFIITFPSLIIFTIAGSYGRGSNLQPFLYILVVATSSTSSLLVVTDPIVIMRNRDVREILAEFRAKMVEKLRPSRVAQEGEASVKQTSVKITLKLSIESKL